jgi:hypothetical protein
MTVFVDVLVLIVFAIWATFAITYHAKAAWFATEYGRNVMGVGAAIAGFLALAAVARWFPQFDRSLLQVLVYSYLGYLGLQRLFQMLRLQKQTREAATLKVQD